MTTSAGPTIPTGDYQVSPGPMRFTHDPEARAYYVYLREGFPITRTISLGDLVMVDIDKDGLVVGVEVLYPALLGDK